MSTDSQMPGTFCWVELGSNDVAAATGFYSQVYGWRAQRDLRDASRPDARERQRERRTAVFIDDEGQPVAGVHLLDRDERVMGTPPHFGCYIAVDDVDAGAADIRAAGGRVTVEPFDVGRAGRMAVAEDPTGASFCIWRSTDRGRGVSPLRGNATGSTCWIELVTTNIVRATAFYNRVFGWQPRRASYGSTTYTMLMIEQHAVAGLTLASSTPMRRRSSWITYFLVDDADAKVALAQQLGGELVLPPTDIPGVGRYAWIADPQGAVSGLLQAVADEQLTRSVA